MRAVWGALPGPGAPSSSPGWSLRRSLGIPLFLTALLWQGLMVASVEAKDQPTLKVSDFNFYPANLRYFQDSDVVLFQDPPRGNVYRSEDAGATWKRIDAVDEGKAFAVILHQYDSKRAYILSDSSPHHWKTDDRGKTWQTFFTDSLANDFRSDWLIFHAQDPDRILFNGMDCVSILCDDVVMYTLDGFKSDAKYLRARTSGCWWAKSSDLFTTGEKELDDSRIICIVRDLTSTFTHENRILISDNFFNAKAGSADGRLDEFEPPLDGVKPVPGVLNVAVVKKFLVAAVASRATDEMALFVTDDTKVWHRAEFPTDHRINQEAYTVLESTNYSIQIDVMTGRRSNPVGVMLSSNSNGTYFVRNVDHTNRNHRGLVDFEKISGIQGIFLVNTVENYEAVLKNPLAQKKIKTSITFDDGRTFEPVRLGDQKLHLHSVTELNNAGRVFSSPAPGLVMGNGNSGDSLAGYGEANLYVSDDAGRSWIKALDGPHKYEFGDQGSVLVAVHNGQRAEVSTVRYSLDHGQNWESVDMPNGLKVKPWVLTTTQDSTSLKFILTAQSEGKYHIVHIDFDGLHESECTDSDMEEWNARVDDDGKASCLMGHTQKYRRRKKNAKCFVKSEFKDPVPESEACVCTDADFECDFNFVREGETCKKAGPVIKPEGSCMSGKADETFKGTSGWRLMPGNDCKRKGGAQKDDKKEWKCSDSTVPPNAPSSGAISHTEHVWEGDFDQFDKHYLERGSTSTGFDETIIARTFRASDNHPGKIMVTQDHGKTWKANKALAGERIWAIVTHHHFKDMAFFLTTKGKKVLYTVDRGVHMDSFEAPTEPDLHSQRTPMAFHPDKKDWIIWHGKKCTETSPPSCYVEASLSEDRGDHWKTINRYVERCEFTGNSAYSRMRPEKQIVCQVRMEENSEPDTARQIVFSNDFFDEHKGTGPQFVKDFATMSEFIVVATENQTEKSLHAWTSVNGSNYARAHFPYGFKVDHQHAYTVLDSSTHAVNLFVLTEADKKHSYGSIIKSNSNGTSFVLSAAGVNCNEDFFVDFEKMLGLPGVALINVVENRDSVSEPKKLQTKISHNDGAEWAFLPPPPQDVDGKAFSCSSKEGTGKCALHIHGYTERRDHGKTYSSESAVGIMFGMGNVGPSLTEGKDADTFMTRDAGMSWRMVKKGRWTWSIGDQGSVIILAQHGARTKTISYTLDEGRKWEDYTISDEEMVITDITTLRSGASRNFLLWGRRGGRLVTINIDFEGLTNRACKFDAKNPEKSDYVLWTPEHPKQPNGCLFGHKTQYLRKKEDRQCYNDQKLPHLWAYQNWHLYAYHNCACTRQDYECDYNFELDNHGACSLVPGFQPISFEQYCRENPDAIDYYEPSGYRRIPLTTCVDGDEFDKMLSSRPCPGKEKEYEKEHAVSPVVVFFAVMIPIGLAAAVGWWVWRQWQGNFGQIRLGEQSRLQNESPWVRYPVMALAGVVAVVSALPLVLGTAMRTAGSWLDRVRGRGSGGGGYSWLRGNAAPTRRFTTRDSFSRGRDDYATVVDEDEGELLGDDSDEEA